MSVQRVKKSEVIHPNLDMTKPLKVDEITAQLNPLDCYGFEWSADAHECTICASKLVCGIIYNNRQKLYIQERNKEKQYLDIVRFDEIVSEDMITWLAYKPRTGKQFIDKVQKFSECSNRQTCVDWVKSFLIDHADVLSVDENKIIIVNQ